MRNRRSNNVKNIKDYIIPVVVFLLISTLIYIAFSGGDDKGKDVDTGDNTLTEESSSLIVNFGDIDTEVEIIKSNNKKSLLDNLGKINLGDSVIVKSGDISFDIPDIASFSLDKNGKIVYSEDMKLKLESSSLWVNTIKSQTLGMRYVTVIIGDNSIVNLEQNEVSSTIYLLKGSVEVKNLVGESTFLSPLKKISISNQNASNKDLDMNLLKEDFGDFFLISDWYIKNSNSSDLLNITEDLNTSSGNIQNEEDKEDEKKENKNIQGLLNFDNIEDEGTVDSPKTNISGIFADDRISVITINDKKVIVNKENKTFNIIGIDTSRKSNDIIIKILDDDGDILGKYVYTLYYNSGKKSNTSTNLYSKINTEAYKVNAFDFIISIPTLDKDGITYSDENTFYGTVKNPDVKSITINGYKLKTYNGKNFRYHAYTRFKTLGEGVNNYEIKYFNAEGDSIFVKYVTINKKTKIKTNIVEPVKRISGEPQI